MTTIAEILRSRHGDTKVGLRFEDQEWTWDEIVQESCDRAAALLDTVPRPADRQVHVGVLLDNVPDFVFWVGACGMAGAVLVGLNSSRSGPEIADDAAHADLDLIITETKWAATLAEGAPAAPVWVVDAEADGDAAYAKWLAPYRGAQLPQVQPSAEDLAMLLFSSGSTGRPKAALVSQGRLGRLTDTLVGRLGIDRDSVTYLSTPLFHGNAVMINLAPAWHAGATVAMVRKFSASRFSDDIHRHGVTFVNYVGRTLSYVLTRPEDPRDRTSTLRLAYGTEGSVADVLRFGERFGCEVMEGYGSSEGVLRINRTPDTPPGALGLPANGADVRVLHQETGEECPRARFDETGRLVNPEAIGELVGVGLAHTFEGYWKNPGAMADRVRGADYWTGDLAYRDEDGWFYFAGRSSEWLRVDSENFAAAQVERVLERYPGTVAAPVFAVADPVTGDQVMTAIELDPDRSFDPVAFGEFLAAQPDMGAKWWPAYVRVVERLPTTGSGKVDKAPLRHVAWNTARDAVYARVGRTAEYVALDAAGRAELVARFQEHGRAAYLPQDEMPA